MSNDRFIEKPNDSQFSNYIAAESSVGGKIWKIARSVYLESAATVSDSRFLSFSLSAVSIWFSGYKLRWILAWPDGAPIFTAIFD